MKPLTENDIRSSLVNASLREAERMPIPGLHEVVWDEREYLGWRDPGAPQRGYLAFWRDGQPIGIAVRASEARIRPGAAMCSLCTTSQPSNQVAMFSAARTGDAGRAGNTIGTYICADLACSLLIRIAPPPYESQPDPAGLVATRAAALEARLRSFTTRLLDAA